MSNMNNEGHHYFKPAKALIADMLFANRYTLISIVFWKNTVDNVLG